LLESEKGELSSLEHEVVRSLQEHELLSADVESEFQQKWSIGERLADKIATFGGSWAALAFMTRLGLGGTVGGGGQWLPWIHLEDHIGLVRHVMSHEAVSGPLNCVAPEPVTHGEFVRSLGEVLGRPTMLKAPLFALRLRYTSQFVDEVLLASQRVMPVRTLETGYAFRHPLLRGALAEVVDKSPRDEAAAAATTT
jgi:hypothetical protein